LNNFLPLISNIIILLFNSADIINFPVQAIPIEITALSFFWKKENRKLNKKYFSIYFTLGKSKTALTFVGKPSERFSNLYTRIILSFIKLTRNALKIKSNKILFLYFT